MSTYKYEKNPNITCKCQNSTTLKTSVYPFESWGAPKVTIEELIKAARDISREITKKKYIELEGIATSKIDPNVIASYSGVIFTVNTTMSEKDAFEAYKGAKHDQEAPERKERSERIGLKLV